jgi:branched-chain amino acid transport system substrate-binding protein
LLAATALGVSACGSSNSNSKAPAKSTNTTSTPATTPPASSGSKAIDIYSSLPMQGASTAQTIPLVNGIKLALAQAANKAGQFSVNYQVLDDSTAASGKWDPGQTAADAR